ncbi:ArsR family transcriptional regulator [Rhodobacteraceae bacterium CCMM004]|nr:ArsR family transcriptional regulator [Rhodobacteraceae bacterium CCMM004]
MSSDRLSITFAALADPTRRAILARLTEGDATVTDLASPFDIGLPSVSKHLKVLERAGLVSKRRRRQERWCRLDAAPLRDAHDWCAIYRAHWDGSLAKLAAHLDEEKDP